MYTREYNGVWPHPLLGGGRVWWHLDNMHDGMFNTDMYNYMHDWILNTDILMYICTFGCSTQTYMYVHVHVYMHDWILNTDILHVYMHIWMFNTDIRACTCIYAWLNTQHRHIICIYAHLDVQHRHTCIVYAWLECSTQTLDSPTSINTCLINLRFSIFWALISSWQVSLQSEKSNTQWLFTIHSHGHMCSACQ